MAKWAKKLKTWPSRVTMKSFLGSTHYNLHEFTRENLSRADVAIDFSTPDSAYSNIMKCFEAGIPVVCGTTGWLNRFEEVKKEMCRSEPDLLLCFQFQSWHEPFLRPQQIPGPNDESPEGL